MHNVIGTTDATIISYIPPSGLLCTHASIEATCPLPLWGLDDINYWIYPLINPSARVIDFLHNQKLSLFLDTQSKRVVHWHTVRRLKIVCISLPPVYIHVHVHVCTHVQRVM